MNRQPSVLLACPISDKKDYCLDRWIDMAKNLNYSNYDILLVDNSHDETYADKIREKALTVARVEPKNDPAPVYICKSQNVMRQYVLELKYDYLFSLECDVFPPKDIISYLLHFNEPNINIPYFLYKDEVTALSMQIIEPNYLNKRMRKISTDESFYNFTGELDYNHIPALGCSLIHRSVLEKVPFRVDLKANRAAFSDTFFHYDCKRHGIPTVTDTSLIVEHDRMGWESSFELAKY